MTQSRIWYDGPTHDMVNVAVDSGGFRVDYDPGRGMYRVSCFDELGHWQDECWFDQYEEPKEPPSDSVSRSLLLRDLDDWSKQVGIYTGADTHEKDLSQLVQEMICQFKVNVENAPGREVVYCKYCCHRQTDACPMYREELVGYDEGGGYSDTDIVVRDYTTDYGFCHCGERGSAEEDTDADGFDPF